MKVPVVERVSSSLVWSLMGYLCLHEWPYTYARLDSSALGPVKKGHAVWMGMLGDSGRPMLEVGFDMIHIHLYIYEITKNE